MSSEPAPPDDLDWIKLRHEINLGHEETSFEKLKRKISDNPFVPLGCLATAGALSYGLYSFRTGNRKMSQQMMRLRIAAQGLTIVALVTGVVMSAKTVK